jgi:hypothetical protein
LGAEDVEKRQTQDTGWFPARDSYEEAVLSWQEQAEQFSRRRRLDAQPTASESRSGQETDRLPTGIAD